MAIMEVKVRLISNQPPLEGSGRYVYMYCSGYAVVLLVQPLSFPVNASEPFVCAVTRLKTDRTMKGRGSTFCHTARANIPGPAALSMRSRSFPAPTLPLAWRLALCGHPRNTARCFLRHACVTVLGVPLVVLFLSSVLDIRLLLLSSSSCFHILLPPHRHHHPDMTRGPLKKVESMGRAS